MHLVSWELFLLRRLLTEALFKAEVQKTSRGKEMRLKNVSRCESCSWELNDSD